MHPLQRSLLRAKHWEIFSVWLVTGLFCLMAASVVNNYLSGSTPVLQKIVSLLLGEATALAVIWPWAYSVGVFCNSIIPASLRLRPARFFLAVAGVLFLDLIYSLLPSLFSIGSWRLALISLLGLLCGAYIARFPAKTLVIAETRKPAVFWQYWGPFLGLVFFPVGIWFLQPYINDLYAAYGGAPVPSSAITGTPNQPV